MSKTFTLAVALETHQGQFIEREARVLGVSRSVYVRNLIERVLTDPAIPRELRAKARAEAAAKLRELEQATEAQP